MIDPFATSPLADPPALPAEAAAPLCPPEGAAGPADLAARLRALAHPARLTVLAALAGRDGCVCGEIVRTLPLAQSTVSQHLKVLLEAGLIHARTEGQRSAYCLDREAVRTLRDELDRLLSAFLSPACCAPQPAGPEQEED